MSEHLDKAIENFNLYERNFYKYIKKYKYQYIKIGNIRELCLYLVTLINRLVFHRVYLNYIEIPITTKCSLKCKECANLIQYYERPYNIESERIIKDIERLSRIVDGIGMLRILGGEPLLHSDIARIVNCVTQNSKIQSVQIVTNGTLLCTDELIKALRNNKKVTIDISYYGKNSIKYTELIRQLKKNHIIFFTNKTFSWTKQSDFRYRGRGRNKLQEVFSQCRMDCISMLNGKLHICPRSSHGDDLKILKADVEDYIDIRKKGYIKDIKYKLFMLLNTKAIRACNYCDIYRWDTLESCIAGEQVSKKNANEIFEMTKRYNKGRCEQCD